MKSILQEASTIAKAIEQAWKEAGEPHNFSIKILELPQRNFIGLTTRSAKIAFIFNEAPVKQTEQATQRHHHAPKPSVHREKQTHRQQQAPTERVERERTERHEPAPSHAKREVEKERPVQENRKKPESLWTPEMIEFTRTWFSKVLQYMEKQDVTFTIEQQNFYLRITLNKLILSDSGQEKHLLASLSLLIISTIKKQFRKALRGHKIVLTHAQSN